MVLLGPLLQQVQLYSQQLLPLRLRKGLPQRPDRIHSVIGQQLHLLLLLVLIAAENKTRDVAGGRGLNSDILWTM
jgi:hypothetical protein